MHRDKCLNCGLVNAADTDSVCQRCAWPLGKPANKKQPRGPREAAQQSSPIYTVLALGLIAIIGVYLYTGFEESYNRISSTEAERLAAQPKPSPAPFTSRVESDQRRAEPYKNAVQNSNGLATSQKHNEDIKQLMQPASSKPRQ